MVRQITRESNESLHHRQAAPPARQMLSRRKLQGLRAKSCRDFFKVKAVLNSGKIARLARCQADEIERQSIAQKLNPHAVRHLRLRGLCLLASSRAITNKVDKTIISRIVGERDRMLRGGEILQRTTSGPFSRCEEQKQPSVVGWQTAIDWPQASNFPR